METLMGQPEPKKRNFLPYLLMLFWGALGGVLVCYLVSVQPAQQKAAKAELQRQETVNTLVNLGHKRVCAAQSFDAAVQLESLVRDTMDAIKVPMSETTRHQIELCAEKFRHAKVEGPVVKPVVKKTRKRK